MSVYGGPELGGEIGSDGSQEEQQSGDSPGVSTETKEVSGVEAGEQTPPDDPSSEAKSFSGWLREMPKSVKYGASGFLAAVAISATAFWAGSQVSKGEVENAQEADNPPADAEDPDEAEEEPGNGSNNGAAEATEAAESDQTEQDEEPPETDANTDTEDAESTDDAEEVRLGMNKDEWIEAWLEDDRVNGKSIAEHKDPQGTRDYARDVISNFTRKLSVTKNAESPGELTSDSVNEVQYLHGVRFMLENSQGTFPVENPIIYGIRPLEETEEDGEIIYGWNERADVQNPGYNNFMIVYPDQNGDWRNLAINDYREVSMPVDGSTRLIGAYVQTEPGNPDQAVPPEIIRARLNWQNLQTESSVIILDNEEGGSAELPLEAENFSNMSEAWDTYREDDFVPISLVTILRGITERTANQ